MPLALEKFAAITVRGDDRAVVRLRDPLHAALRNAGKLNHLLERVPGPAQHLDLVWLEHGDHPFPRHLARWQVF